MIASPSLTTAVIAELDTLTALKSSLGGDIVAPISLGFRVTNLFLVPLAAVFLVLTAITSIGFGFGVALAPSLAIVRSSVSSSSSSSSYWFSSRA